MFKNYDKKIEELESRIKKLEENTRVQESFWFENYHYHSLFYDPPTIPVNKAIKMILDVIGYRLIRRPSVPEIFNLEKIEEEDKNA